MKRTKSSLILAQFSFCVLSFCVLKNYFVIDRLKDSVVNRIMSKMHHLWRKMSIGSKFYKPQSAFWVRKDDSTLASKASHHSGIFILKILEIYEDIFIIIFLFYIFLFL